MLMKLKALVFTVMLAAVSVSSAGGEGVPKPWWQNGGQDEEKNNGVPTLEVPGPGRADAKMVATKTTKCRNDAKNPSIVPITGNSVIDTRCSLIAFEVCMNEEIGAISQSQDARKQCAIIKGLGGDAACRQTCIKAAKLPVGGDGVVGNYTGLTPYAVSCYDEARKRMDGVDSMKDACNQNIALQCLMNGSKSSSVNATILQERKNACKSYKNTYGGACVACSGENVRVNYDSSIMDLDSKYCTPALAAAKYCTMPATGDGN